MIDLVVVAAIIGILAAVALPAYQDNTSRARMFKPGAINMQRVSHLDMSDAGDCGCEDTPSKKVSVVATVPSGAASATMTGSLPAATSLWCR